MLEAPFDAHLDLVDGQLAEDLGNVLHVKTHGHVVLLVETTQQLRGIVRQVRQAGGVLAEVAVALVLFQIERNRQTSLNLVDAVFLIRIAEETGEGIEQLLQIRDRHEAQQLEAEPVGAGGQTPRLGLVETGQALALREEGDHPFQVLGQVGAIGQFADERDVIQDPLIAGHRDDEDRLHVSLRRGAAGRAGQQ